MTALIVGSLWTSAVIRSYAWMILFQRYGIVNEALIWLGFADSPVRILQTTTAVVIGMVHVDQGHAGTLARQVRRAIAWRAGKNAR